MKTKRIAPDGWSCERKIRHSCCSMTASSLGERVRRRWPDPAETRSYQQDPVRSIGAISWMDGRRGREICRRLGTIAVEERSPDPQGQRISKSPAADLEQGCLRGLPVVDRFEGVSIKVPSCLDCGLVSRFSRGVL
jgi:hypothetical protein